MDTNTKRVMFSNAKTGGKDHFETPKAFYKKLDSIYQFTLDPASSQENHKCERYFTMDDDGLAQNWEGHTVFVNPPYSQNKRWIEKCYLEGQKENTKVVTLIPARTETKFWHEYCMRAKEIFFIKGRLYFELDGKRVQIPERKNGVLTGRMVETAAPFPSAVVVFDGTSKLPICKPMERE